MIEIRSLQPLKYSLSADILYTRSTGTGGGHLPPLLEIEQNRTKGHKNVTPSFNGSTNSFANAHERCYLALKDYQPPGMGDAPGYPADSSCGSFQTCLTGYGF